MSQETVQLILTGKDWLEIIYFITAGPVLMTITGFGLYQLRLMKEQINSDKEAVKLNSKRESIRLANEQCNFYLNTIDKNINQVDKIMKEKGIEYLTKENFISYKIENKKILIEYNENRESALITMLEHEECLEKIVDVIKELEVFSSYFTSKIADSEIGYKTVGEHFINEVKRFIFLILIESDSQNEKTNKNIIELFLIWNNIQEQETLENEWMEDVKKANAKRDQLDKNKKVNIKPLGT